MKTDYFGHDARYRRLREQGAPGWDTADEYREREAELGWAFDVLAQGTSAATSGSRVLELGCGAGNIAASLIERGHVYTGIDISPTAIAWASERALPSARFMVGDLVAAIPGDYDIVIDGHCLHCIIGEDRSRVLEHVHRALVPGGHFFVATMCGEITIPALRACFDPVTRCQIVDGVAYRFIGDADELLDELRTAGFEIVSSTIARRTDDDDQDHLWALARRPLP